MKALLFALLFFPLTSFPATVDPNPNYIDKICKDEDGREWLRNITYIVRGERLTADCVGSQSIVLMGEAKHWRKTIRDAFILAVTTKLIPVIVLSVEQIEECDYAHRAKDEIDTYADDIAKEFELKESIPYLLGLVGKSRKLCLLTNA